MEVQMIDGLTTIASAVDHNAIASFAQSELACDCRYRRPDMPQQSCIRGGYIFERLDRLLGDYEYMDRSFRRDIAECQAECIIVNDIRFNLTAHNLCKDRIRHSQLPVKKNAATSRPHELGIVIASPPASSRAAE
jgi:hypothetical protein